MASNFKISIDGSEERIHIGLHGDFDGSSAHELINLLRKYWHRNLKIQVHTQGLNQIYPFGLTAFNKSLGIMSDGAGRIVFSGNKASDFANRSEYRSV